MSASPPAAATGWFVYVLVCADGSLYTGVTVDLQRRLRQHNGAQAGGPRYTRGRRPVRLRWSEQLPDRAAAQRREAAIKRLPRAAKLVLLQGDLVLSR
jgi:putative endonuclease